MYGHANCIQFIRKQNVPFILLGGGGYTVKNVARTWTYETACALGIENEIDPNLPWNDYFEWFGPRYRLEVPENNMEDLNTKDGSLDIIRFVDFDYLSVGLKYQFFLQDNCTRARMCAFGSDARCPSRKSVSSPWITKRQPQRKRRTGQEAGP